MKRYFHWLAVVLVMLGALGALGGFAASAYAQTEGAPSEAEINADLSDIARDASIMQASPLSQAAREAKAAASPKPHVPRLSKPSAGKGNASSPSASSDGDRTALALRIAIGLTLVAVVPGLLVCMTAFLRIIIVLSMLRHAIGMQETPPNTALIGIAIFLTMFTMAPVIQTVNTTSLQPFLAGKTTPEQAYERGIVPLRDYMVRQTREQDLALMVELSRAPQPRDMTDISNVQLIPAYMLSELRAAFQIGFMVFLPFILIDLIVSSLLMALGMMMMPPATIALPLKILMFILVDGWGLLLRALVGSFH
ncbi:flagellar biosynthetic protein FliP [Pandoraea communis]|uniref:Flagellar biosynthetic protein FliP n=1 Tax=Pandoraea communis TaxID=2508297 RepID=A0A5E4YPA0_9BURK|nr:flagellar type III secretion system pore protein FliP [Pandoraea communis]VVE50649.1 flagellar biosynthetic protein FliP [Pandoraea communis]